MTGGPQLGGRGRAELTRVLRKMIVASANRAKNWVINRTGAEKPLPTLSVTTLQIEQSCVSCAVE